MVRKTYTIKYHFIVTSHGTSTTFPGTITFAATQYREDFKVGYKDSMGAKSSDAMLVDRPAAQS
jgi:hypothetical protein